eukprot:Plantae.Rhodophyta-Hildenbrandia_rubra.ctg17609.p2 GENE.Plantae.Rhodophyta-Hildenbrandia_rubra.ctg17609~~Plantae.Rhodophyta-Hildenbrandia_rubra.ctg17609.p2  ORF type:complete len:231 (+),score=64.91 Plantae.Rhodophyta-Hildenbrandia_rubra.ctg17609:205-897(+)
MATFLSATRRGVLSLVTRQRLCSARSQTRAIGGTAPVFRQKKSPAPIEEKDDVPNFDPDSMDDMDFDPENMEDQDFSKMSPPMLKNIRESFASRAMFVIRSEYLAEQAAREGEHGMASALRSVAETGKMQAQGLMDLTSEYEGIDIVTGDAAGELENDVDNLIKVEEKEVEEMFPKFLKTSQDDDGVPDVADVWEDLSAVTEKNIAVLKDAKEKLTVQEYDDEDNEELKA